MADGYKGLVLAAVAVGFTGCSDYNYTPDEAVTGTPNPPDLETPVVTDRIVQSPVSLVDILFVVDTSCSMLEEQELLAANMPSFMQFFLNSGLDYHVGVVSTNMDSTYPDRGKLVYASNGQNFITPDTRQPIEVFEEMAVLGTDSHFDEKGRAAAYTALVDHRDTYNRGFYRQDATLSIVVISDEDDYSGNVPVSQQEFIDWLDTVKGDPGRTSFSAIVTDTPSCGDFGSEVGYEYLAVAEATGGVTWSICTDRWDAALEELGMEAAGMRREFYLSQVPIEDTLTVQVLLEEGDVIDFVRVDAATSPDDWGPEGQPAEFTYDRSRNSIRFVNLLPPPLSEVLITYEVLAATPVGPGDGAEDTEAVPPAE